MTIGVPEPQAALDRIRIVENDDPLVDLRTLGVGLTFRDDHELETLPYLREPVAHMLAEAARKLAPEWTLHVTSAFRPIEQQISIWNEHYTRNRREHPDWPESSVRRLTNKYVAPIDHPAPPGHSTGAAVDVVLQKADGSFVDLVPPFLTDWTLGHTYTDAIDPETKALRMLLVDTMLSVGFSNCRDEYWHYSWGDSGWAVRTGASECPYGSASL